MVVVVVVVMLVVLVVVPTYSDREGANLPYGVNLDTFSDTMYHVPCTSVTVMHKK